MLQLHDIRETRVYQEGREEGLREAILNMASEKISAADIARILKLDLEFVKRSLARNGQQPAAGARDDEES